MSVEAFISSDIASRLLSCMLSDGFILQTASVDTRAMCNFQQKRTRVFLPGTFPKDSYLVCWIMIQFWRPRAYLSWRTGNCNQHVVYKLIMKAWVSRRLFPVTLPADSCLVCCLMGLYCKLHRLIPVPCAIFNKKEQECFFRWHCQQTPILYVE